MLITDSDITPEWLLIWHGTAVWCLNRWMDHKKGNIQQLALLCSFKAVVSDCITTLNDKVPDFEVSWEPCSTSWSNIICGMPSNVLHFPYFPLTVANFPLLNSQTSFLYVRKSKLPFLSKNHTNHRLGHSCWQPITKLQLTSLATEQTIWWTTKREGCRLSQGPGMDILYHDAPEGLPKQLWMIYWDGK